MAESEARPSPPPGWYADPYLDGHLRWWDGTDWTEDRRGAITGRSAPSDLDTIDQWSRALTVAARVPWMGGSSGGGF
jgi:Protein of unknown function (DUF2510)